MVAVIRYVPEIEEADDNALAPEFVPTAPITVTLENGPPPGDWVRHGRCVSVPVALFFPGRGDGAGQAKRICARCPVIEECREYAIPQRALQGVFGGTTPDEREAIRVERKLEVLDAEPETEAVEDDHLAQAEAGALLAVLEQLALHPGRWAKVGHFASRGSAATTASLLRTGRRDVPPGRWEFEGRLNDAGGSDLYAICVETGASSETVVA